MASSHHLIQSLFYSQGVHVHSPLCFLKWLGEKGGDALLSFLSTREKEEDPSVLGWEYSPPHLVLETAEVLAIFLLRESVLNLSELLYSMGIRETNILIKL